MRKNCIIFIGFILFFLIANFNNLFGEINYVKADASGNNDGTSWNDAFILLQSGIEAASSGDTIWVAAGTYFPTKKVGGTTEHHRTFQMKNDVAIYGGFAGIEDPATFDLDNRDFTTYETILSGDLNQDDSTYFADYKYIMENLSDNCYHIFRHPESLALNRTAILNGFTITGGNSLWEIGDDPDELGGAAIRNIGASPTFQHLNITMNRSENDREVGIVFNSSSSAPKFENIDFLINNGSAMYNLNSSPEVYNVTIKHQYGGNSVVAGFHNVNSSAVLTNIQIDSVFSGSGCGITENGSSSLLTNIHIKDGGCEPAGSGIALINSSTTINYATITGIESHGGGGIWISGNSTPVLNYIKVYNNSSWQGGSGIFIDGPGTSPELNNVLVADNFSYEWASGVSLDDSAHAVVNNMTIANNKCRYYGPGLFLDNGSTIEMNNCIIWGNQSGHGDLDNLNNGDAYSGIYQISIDVSSVDFLNSILDNINYTCIDTTNPVDDPLYDYMSNYLGNNDTNVVQNPQFADSTNDPVNPFCLTGISPCVDAGNNDCNSQEYGIRGAGFPRKIDGNTGGPGTIDMGAYEYKYGTDPTLPIVLSCFNANYTDNQAQLYWQTQTETDNVGWNVYRNSEDSFESAVQVNNELIPGHGTTTQPREYNFIDHSLQNIQDTIYYYWIENIELSGETRCYAPVIMEIITDPQPGSSDDIEFDGFYHVLQSPFRSREGIDISFNLKNKDVSSVELKIFNMKGQRIKTLFKGESSGELNCHWDGKDEHGNIQGSGVYLYLLQVNGKYYDTQKVIMFR